MSKPIILASSSPFRRELLARLGLDFECISPEVDETPLEIESAHDLALRLAESKAQIIAQSHPDAIVIGSDQVAEVKSQLLGKPGNRGNAIEQLSLSSGQAVNFRTGLSVIYGNKILKTVIPYTVYFRELDQATIERYVDQEQPFNCAGSFKSEGLGISLFERQSGDDPTALIGLPLIQTCVFLRQLGIQIP